MQPHKAHILDPITNEKIELTASTQLEFNALVIGQISLLKQQAIASLTKIGILFVCTVLLMSVGNVVMPYGHVVAGLIVLVYITASPREWNPVKQFRYTWQCLKKWEDVWAAKVDSADARIVTPEE